MRSINRAAKQRGEYVKMNIGYLEHNFTYIMQNFIEWSTGPYITAIGFFFWPLVFTGLIGYVYLKNQSLVIAAAGILMIMAVFGNALIGVQPFLNFLYIAVAAIAAGLFVMIFLRGRGK